MREGSCLRELSHQHIDRAIRMRNIWRREQTKNLVTETMAANLHDMADILLATEIKYKLVVSGDCIWLYTNDLDFVETISQLPYISFRHYYQSVVTKPKDCVSLRQPKHQFRSYFRNIKLEYGQRTQLVNFLDAQRSHVRISPGLTDWMTQNKWHRTQDHYFVDYDHEAWLIMLALVNPKLIRKTLKIVATK
jgi:hypothetical protein